MNIIWKKNEEKEIALNGKKIGRGHSAADSLADSRKTEIVIPEGASVELPNLPILPGFSVISILQKPYSKLTLPFIQNAPQNFSGTFIIRITLERGARLESTIAMFGGSSINLFMETSLIGEESSVQEQTVYFGNEKQNFTMVSHTKLTAKNTRARISSKGVLNDCANARFDGQIHIEQTAKGAQAELFEHTLLLSPHAQMNAIPGLNIETNDVIATHSASMTRVDDEQLFFAESRGIDEATAIRLIAEGFLKSATEKTMPEIDSLIQEKLCKL